ncbi:MAG TPA: tyrosine-type recombinase/integrase, partial [Pirellulales bacterium]|nr:tyrosine-type recombinase/integrase [Pirellulales bacterium]
GLLDQLDLDRIAGLAEQIRAASTAAAQRKAEQLHRRAKAVQGAVPKALRRPRKLRDVYAIASDSPRTLRRFFRDVYYPRRLKPFDASEGTVDRYESIFNRLAAFVGAEVTLDGLAAPGFLEDVQGWMIATGRSPHTVNGVIAHLRALWRYAKRKELAGGNPDFIDKLTVRKKDPEAWSLEELGRILAAATTLRGRFNGLPYNRLLPAFMLVLFDTALRAGAAIQIRTNDLGSDGRLAVDAATQKHKMDQSWRLTSQTLAAIELLSPASREMLFAGPYRRPGERAPRKEVILVWRRLSKALKRACRIAGVAGAKPGFHKIRRTSATQACAVGGRALAVAHCGHSHESVTAAYIDPRFIQRPDVVALLPRPDYQPAAEPPLPRLGAGLLEYRPAIVESEGGSR